MRLAACVLVLCVATSSHSVAADAEGKRNTGPLRKLRPVESVAVEERTYFSVLSCSQDTVEIEGNSTYAPGDLFAYAENDYSCRSCSPLIRKVVSVSEGTTNQDGETSLILQTSFAVYGDVFEAIDASLASTAIELLFDCEHSTSQTILEHLQEPPPPSRQLQAFPSTCGGFISVTNGECDYTDCTVGGGETDNYDCYPLGRGEYNGCGNADITGLIYPVGTIFEIAGVGWSFEEACCKHDFCYSTFFSRTTCDVIFGAELQQQCIDRLCLNGIPGICLPGVYPICTAIGGSYAALVATIGSSSYGISQANAAAHAASSTCNPNRSPTCRILVIGPTTRQCRDSEAIFQLDGRSSSDPDGNPLLYQWESNCRGKSFTSNSASNPVLRVGATSTTGTSCTVSLTVSDGSLTDTCSQTITVRDTTNPEITAPQDIVQQHTCSLPNSVSLGSPQVKDSCTQSGLVVVRSPSSTAFEIGTTSVQWTVTDGAGNSATDMQMVTLLNTAPVAEDIAVSFQEDSSDNQITLVATDTNDPVGATFPCDIASYEIKSSPSHGSLSDMFNVFNVFYTPDSNFYGMDSFTYTATDQLGAESEPQTVSITIEPVNDPPTCSLLVAASTTAECENSEATFQLDGRSSIDIDGDQLSYQWSSDCVGSSFSSHSDSNPVLRVGATSTTGTSCTVSLTVSDGSLTDTCSQTITVRDTTNPEITAPQDIVQQHTCSLPNSVSLGSPQVKDSCTQSGLVVVRSPSSTAFEIGTTSVQWTVTDGAGNSATDMQMVTLLNTAPVAEDIAVSFQEDSSDNQITLVATDINDPVGATFPCDIASYEIKSSPSHGSLSDMFNVFNVFYTPDSNFYGMDSFTYTATDQLGAESEPQTVSITIEPVNDPPVISISPTTVSLQYSDHVEIVITASDRDDSSLELTYSYADGLDTVTNGLPSALYLEEDCTSGTESNGFQTTSCNWVVKGPVRKQAGLYTIAFVVTDDGGSPNGVPIAVSVDTTLNVSPEDTSVLILLDDSITKDVSESIAIQATVKEQEPDVAFYNGVPGDVNLALLSMTLLPIAPGPEVSVPCLAVTPASDAFALYGTASYSCTFNSNTISTNFYSLVATVDGGFYAGSSEIIDKAVSVFDTGLGFSEGKGWFYWPGTMDRTEFRYSVSYMKGKGVHKDFPKGNLVITRQLGDGDKHEVRANGLFTILTLGSGPSTSFSWAMFDTSCRYVDPSSPIPNSEHELTMYVEDYSVSGSDGFRLWLEVRDSNGVVVPNFSMDRTGTENAVQIEDGAGAVTFS